MRRTLLTLFALLLPLAAAEDTAYLGVRLAGSSLEPFLGAQVGAQVAGPLELRVGYDVSVGVYRAHADLLYTQPFGSGVRGYVGVGPERLDDGWTGRAAYGVHATAGAEYRSGVAGFFAEVQPAYLFDLDPFSVRLGLGVNFYLF